jgi:hypothetical protein
VLLAYFPENTCPISPVENEAHFDELREYYDRAIDCRGVQFFDNLGERIYPERKRR